MLDAFINAFKSVLIISVNAEVNGLCTFVSPPMDTSGGKHHKEKIVTLLSFNCIALHWQWLKRRACETE